MPDPTIDAAAELLGDSSSNQGTVIYYDEDVVENANPHDLKKAIILANSKNLALDAAVSIVQDLKQGKLKTKSAWKSKTIGLAAGGISMVLGTYMGLEVPPETLNSILAGQGISIMAIIGIVRRYFTTKALH